MEARHVHQNNYQSLPDFNAQLNVSILCRPDADIEFSNTTDHLAPYLDRLDRPEVLTIHFEDLIHDRATTLAHIMAHHLTHASLPSTRKLLLDSLDTSNNPKKTPTLRSGRTGEGIKHIADEHKKIFKDMAGGLLVKLGYEKNNDW
jgi:hypothetical protein